jgi:hypothetical protein
MLKYSIIYLWFLTYACRSVGIVRYQTKATEFSLVFLVYWCFGVAYAAL